jgi:hypothetical protein
MSVVTPHQTDLTTSCKFKRDPRLRRALHLLLNLKIDLTPFLRSLDGWPYRPAGALFCSHYCANSFCLHT